MINRSLFLTFLYVSIFTVIQLTTSAQESANEIYAVAWSPNGQYIAFGGGSGECSNTKLEQFGVSVFNIATNQIDKILIKHRCRITDLDWSSDSNYIVSASEDEIAVIWDVSTGLAVTISDFEAYGRNSIQFSADNSKVLNGLISNTLFSIWDAQTGQTLHYMFGEHNEVVRSVDWSFDNTKIASGSRDTKIEIFDTQTQEKLYELEGHTEGVYYVKWNSNSTLLASTSEDMTVRIWNMQTLQLIRTMPFKGRKLEWHPQNNIIAVASLDGLIAIWNADTCNLEEEITSNIGAVYDLAWNPNGSSFVYVGEETLSNGSNLQIVPFSLTANPTPTPTNTPTPTPAPHTLVPR